MEGGAGSDVVGGYLYLVGQPWYEVLADAGCGRFRFAAGCTDGQARGVDAGVQLAFVERFTVVGVLFDDSCFHSVIPGLSLHWR